MEVGTIVETVALPPGVRVAKPKIGSRGIVVDRAWRNYHGCNFLLVAFRKPFEDATGGTWLDEEDADRHYICIGYIPEEIKDTGLKATIDELYEAQQSM